MINPSTNGWIDKFFAQQQPLALPVVIYSKEFYLNVRNTGFIYGHTVEFDVDKPINTKGWTTQEITKIALLNTLYGVFGLITHEGTPKDFIEKANGFYKQMNPEGFNLLKKMLPERQYYQQKFFSHSDQRAAFYGCLGISSVFVTQGNPG